MRHVLAILSFLLLPALLMSAACESTPERTRCANCGMYTDLDPSFAASLGERSFDAPKCLWRALLKEGGNPSRATVTLYYTREPAAADSVLYVVGSAVRGPMGADLIPVSGRESAASFIGDHGGRVVKPLDVDQALVDSL